MFNENPWTRLFSSLPSGVAFDGSVYFIRQVAGVDVVMPESPIQQGIGKNV